MTVSRRELLRLTAGGSAVAALGQLGLSSALAADTSGYRAMVGVFLFGGNDAWNMVAPTDSRYADYAKQRGSSLALAQSSLVPLTGTAAFALPDDALAQVAEGYRSPPAPRPAGPDSDTPAPPRGSDFL